MKKNFSFTFFLHIHVTSILFVINVSVFGRNQLAILLNWMYKYLVSFLQIKTFVFIT